jgi:hypothetical protein
MQQILEGEAQFAHPEQHSIYFKWGKENNRAILNGYIHNYEEKRRLFNKTSG